MRARLGPLYGSGPVGSRVGVRLTAVGVRHARRALRILGAVVVALGPVASIAVAVPARGEDLHVSLPRDLSLTLGGGGAALAASEVQEELAPPHCRWCDRDEAGKDMLNALDRDGRRLRWKDTKLASALSSVGLLVTPVLSGGLLAVSAAHDGRGGEIGADTLVVVESAVFAADLNQLAKLLVARERPDAHARALAEPTLLRRSADDDLSFYSGHTTVAVAVAVASGTVASVRGYRLAPLVWGASLPFALGTGYLRIGADRHYVTDVLAGVALGAAVGCLVPLVMKSAAATPYSPPAPTAQSPTLGFSGVW